MAVALNSTTCFFLSTNMDLMVSMIAVVDERRLFRAM